MVAVALHPTLHTVQHQLEATAPRPCHPTVVPVMVSVSPTRMALTVAGPQVAMVNPVHTPLAVPVVVVPPAAAVSLDPARMVAATLGNLVTTQVAKDPLALVPHPALKDSVLQ